MMVVTIWLSNLEGGGCDMVIAFGLWRLGYGFNVIIAFKNGGCDMHIVFEPCWLRYGYHTGMVVVAICSLHLDYGGYDMVVAFG